MTTRERNLATILVAILLLIGGVLLGKVVFYDPMRELADQKEQLNQQISKRDLEIQEEKNYVSAAEKLSPQLAQWRKLSLPARTPEKADPKAAKGPPNPVREAEENRQHVSRVRDEYQKILKDLLKKANFRERLFKPNDLDSRPSAAANSRVQPAFQVLPYSIEG